MADETISSLPEAMSLDDNQAFPIEDGVSTKKSKIGRLKSFLSQSFADKDLSNLSELGEERAARVSPYNYQWDISGGSVEINEGGIIKIHTPSVNSRASLFIGTISLKYSSLQSPTFPPSFYVVNLPVVSVQIPLLQGIVLFGQGIIDTTALLGTAHVVIPADVINGASNDGGIVYIAGFGSNDAVKTQFTTKPNVRIYGYAI